MKNQHFGAARPRSVALLGSLALLGGCAEIEEGSHVEGAEEVGATEQALSSADVFGFENLGLWTVSSGTKHTLTTATQGVRALGVSNTYYSEISSAVIDSVGVVSNDLALDVKLPSAASWGDLKIVVEIPSKGIWYGDLGAKPLASIPAGSFQTLHFQVPPNVLTALQGNPSDLKVRIVLNGQVGSTPVAFDHLRFVSGNTGPSVVELRVAHVDDVAFLKVNGLYHRIGYWGAPNQGDWVDVSDWFVAGENDVRLFASNYGGPGALDVAIRVDGVVVANVACDGTTCPVLENETFVDQVIDLPTLSLPPGRQVQVTSPTPGKIYLDDQYTGLSTPATLTLPSGEYRLGLGVSNDAPVNTTGSFHEETIVVGSSNLSVVVGDTAPLGPTNVSKIAILPVRRARVVDTNQVAVLSDADVVRFGSQVEATSAKYLEPFSYGLNSWDVTVLPIEEELELVAPNWAEFPDHSCGDIVFQPKYAGLFDQYDTIVVHFSNTNAEGVEIGRGDAGMAGRCGQVQKHWGVNLPSSSPLPVVLHEVLHSYETHHWEIERRWNGVSGLHGAQVHGFQSTGTQGEIEWTEWYRHFLRDQAAEISSMAGGDVRPSPVSPADYYVGVFRTARYGLWVQQ